MKWTKFKKPIIALAPMADMTDSPFCRVCRLVNCESEDEESLFNTKKDANNKTIKNPKEKGSLSVQMADRDYQPFIIFREMVSAEAIIRGSAKTLKMCEFKEIERPIVVQLFGSDPDRVAQAAKIVVEKFHPDGIDINMGCPVPKITNKNSAGASLMRDHERAINIVKALKNADLGVPVSVKTRLGWGNDDEILEFAPKLEQAGVDLISIHGRTKVQGYSGKANWERIAQVKKLLKIPVLANGDINSQEDIEACLKITGADGVMIGRGALGNPWIFVRNKEKGIRNNIDEVKRMILRHAELHIAHYGEKFGLKTFRKHLLLYFKNIPGMKELKKELVKVNTIEDLRVILNKI